MVSFNIGFMVYYFHRLPIIGGVARSVSFLHGWRWYLSAPSGRGGFVLSVPVPCWRSSPPGKASSGTAPVLLLISSLSQISLSGDFALGRLKF